MTTRTEMLRALVAFAAMTAVGVSSCRRTPADAEMLDSKLTKVLKRVKSSQMGLDEALGSLKDPALKSDREIRLLSEVLQSHEPMGRPSQPLRRSELSMVAALLQNSGDANTALIRKAVLPQVLLLLDRHAEHRDVNGWDIVFAAKVLSLYGDADVVPRIGKLARSEWLANEYLWTTVFNIYADPAHPHQMALLNELARPLPSGFASIALLDFANTVGREGGLKSHPFDTEEGTASLKRWLESTNEEEVSYAFSSAAALPFLSESRRTALLELARQHRADGVRLEAAWAGAKLGYEEDVARLVSAAVDPNHSERAVAYLDELGLTERIPSEASDPDFRAKAEMAAWLAHPMEFGRPPERLAMADRRTIHWPPTRDLRTVYLFKYEYPPAEDSEEPNIGYGMVGSVTFALVGESTEDKTPAEIYALHCAWELEGNEDPRAPKERTVAAGLRILRQANPDVPDFNSK